MGRWPGKMGISRGWRWPAHPGWLRKLARECRGALLMETVMAVMAFTLVGTAALVGLSTTQISGAKTEDQSIAENLARNQMEHVFSLPYQDPPSSYPSVAAPPGYSVATAATEFVAGDVRIEKIVVTVTHGGQGVLTLETLRAK